MKCHRISSRNSHSGLVTQLTTMKCAAALLWAKGAKHLNHKEGAFNYARTMCREARTILCLQFPFISLTYHAIGKARIMCTCIFYFPLVTISGEARRASLHIFLLRLSLTLHCTVASMAMLKELNWITEWFLGKEYWSFKYTWQKTE